MMVKYILSSIKMYQIILHFYPKMDCMLIKEYGDIEIYLKGHAKKCVMPISSFFGYQSTLYMKV